ncbi:MAG: sulfite exporter TauE/SafE family protein [Mariprofundus sp.]|nr:sulfite exporter TauE/SafE family protein [Mariprofundus sp.]
MSLAMWLAAPCIGLVLTMFAAGGGMIAVPLLTFGVGLPLKEAIATSLIIVACVSAVALLQNKRWKLISWQLHRFFGSGGMIGGFAGASFGLKISDDVQTIVFALLVFLIAWLMNSGLMKEQLELADGKLCNCRYVFLAGVVAGTVTAMLGVGGGFLIVPLLLMLGVDSYQSAVAHSLIMIVSSSLVAVLRYAESLSIAWQPSLVILVLALLGTWLGNFLLDRYSTQRLQKGFSLMLCIMAAWMIWKTFSAI